MFTIEKTEMKGERFPDEDYLRSYGEGGHIGELVSTVGLDALLSGRTYKEVGDSNIFVCIESTGDIGEAGKQGLKSYTEDFVRIVREAIPVMTDRYAGFYKHFIEDYEKNGLVMPMYGRL